MGEICLTRTLGPVYEPPCQIVESPSPLTSPYGGFAEFVDRVYFPLDNDWRAWLGSSPAIPVDFRRKPHWLLTGPSGDLALAIYKRGGTMKVVPAVDNRGLSESLIQKWEQQARSFGQRKISVFWPATDTRSDVMAAAGYAKEACLPTGLYAVNTAIEIWSRFI
jgi:hypothetical protein